MNAKELVYYIHKEQVKTFCSVNEFKNTKTLATKQRGLYWFWTNLENNQLRSIKTKEGTKEVPFYSLINNRVGLKNICSVNLNGFTVVYNGIGGYHKPFAFGLRERINQEINCNDYRTGTLNIQRRTNLDNWGITYFNFDDSKHQDALSTYTSKNQQWIANNFYKSFAKELENLWRLEFGTPILCRL
ncbi:hypothetical protein [Tenacibaculum mesophilum]|uniref:hypothetical protein n=1 Tax=Tenacibaculum mesophilum TaxID=104268 RepID=UPI00064AE409|nr:hypothetical protein [Tenacibaculum mesophilum]